MKELKNINQLKGHKIFNKNKKVRVKITLNPYE